MYDICLFYIYIYSFSIDVFKYTSSFCYYMPHVLNSKNTAYTHDI